ncbi:MAG: glycosyltransferase [Limnochordales bacterium]|nr:glycosyltransferase [Limnochordales bacterium]
MRVSAVIPAYNEEERVADTVRALLGSPLIDEVVVVDDGSRDRTAIRAAAAGARVVSLPRNRGKSAALAAGVREAQGEVLLFVDADVGRSAALLPLLLGPVLAGKADMVIADLLPPVATSAVRHRTRGGGFGLAVGAAARAVRELTGWQPRSPLSGQRALRREVWERASPLPPGFGVEVALTIRSLLQGFRVMELPVAFEHRVTGWDWRSIYHRAKQWWAIRRAIRICRREALSDKGGGVPWMQ